MPFSSPAKTYVKDPNHALWGGGLDEEKSQENFGFVMLGSELEVMALISPLICERRKKS